MDLDTDYRNAILTTMSKSTPYTQSGQALQTQHANSPAEVIKQRKAFLDARLAALGRWVRGGVRPEALIRFSLLDMQQNTKLREADPESIYLALLACAVCGLEPGALKGEAYLVPFSGRAQFMAGYRGLIKMAKRSGEVHGISANVVHERDVCELDLGSEPRLVHRPAFGDRGVVIGAYAVAKMATGNPEIEWLALEDIERIRNVAESRSKSPAWQQWPEEMAKKSAIRRLSKRLPLGHDYIISAAIENAQEETGDAKAVLDLETDGEATRTKQSAERAQEMREQVQIELDPDEMAEIMKKENASHE